MLRVRPSKLLAPEAQRARCRHETLNSMGGKGSKRSKMGQVMKQLLLLRSSPAWKAHIFCRSLHTFEPFESFPAFELKCG
jgi:hypothetical protein